MRLRQALFNIGLGLLVGAAPGPQAWAFPLGPRLSAGLEVGTEGWFELEDVHCTQAYGGLEEVDLKVDDYGKLGDPEYQELLEEKRVDVVIGPDGRIFPDDHHHTFLALLKAGKPIGYGRLVADYSKLSWEEFWPRMEREGRAFLKDPLGRPIEGSRIPDRLTGLLNWPARAAVYFLRKAKVIKKPKVKYGELEVAIALEKIHRFGSGPSAARDAVPALTALLRGPDAPAIPGLKVCPAIFSEEKVD